MKTQRDEIRAKLESIARECKETEPDIAVTLLSLCGAIACREESQFAAFAKSHAEEMLSKFANKLN